MYTIYTQTVSMNFLTLDNSTYETRADQNIAEDTARAMSNLRSGVVYVHLTGARQFAVYERGTFLGNVAAV